jgi:phosphatidylglycerophosphatase C
MLTFVAEMTMLAVFDMDGTLLDGDSTATWMWEHAKQSPLRMMAALAVLPLALPMVALPSTRRAGASVLLWIATAGLSERQLAASCERFAQAFRSGRNSLTWKAQALSALEDHARSGDRIVVVTAAPTCLAKALLDTLDRPVELLGTSLKPVLGGWVADIHCRHQRKCQALAEAGHGARWAYAYTDSLDDLPILRAADKPVIVKGGRAAERRLFRAGLLNGRAAAW